MILGIGSWLLGLLLSVFVFFSISEEPQQQHHPKKVLAQTPVETRVVSTQLEIDPRFPSGYIVVWCRKQTKRTWN